MKCISSDLTSHGNRNPSAPRASGRGNPRIQIWAAWKRCSTQWMTTMRRYAHRARSCHWSLSLSINPCFTSVVVAAKVRSLPRLGRWFRPR